MIYLVRYHADAPPDIAVCEGEPPARYADYVQVTRTRWLDAWWERDQWQAHDIRQTIGVQAGTCTAPLGGGWDGPPPAVALEARGRMGTVVIATLPRQRTWEG